MKPNRGRVYDNLASSWPSVYDFCPFEFESKATGLTLKGRIELPVADEWLHRCSGIFSSCIVLLHIEGYSPIGDTHQESRFVNRKRPRLAVVYGLAVADTID